MDSSLIENGPSQTPCKYNNGFAFTADAYVFYKL